ncbi:non-heme iron oxygenase ferredoxin subunit [Microbacterium sp. NPDC064584]|jgi:3-phenylpropionate/trans-cinnamate dioxygenase ferredoxin subunit|uniref:non-heme iron oxygenase ferredoxin subunit n=1 Tax=Microbacterium sp. NPDC064584 TaxID=3155817 RepID=UPI0034144EDD
MAARIVAAKVGDVVDGEAIVVSKAVTGTVDDIALFLDDGEYYALDNTCSHELASLADGWIERGVVECPTHTGRFCLRDGKVLSAPATEDVAAHQVHVDGEEIVIVPNPVRLATP